jgi:hypothetical protein
LLRAGEECATDNYAIQRFRAAPGMTALKIMKALKIITALAMSMEREKRNG